MNSLTRTISLSAVAACLIAQSALAQATACEAPGEPKNNPVVIENQKTIITNQKTILDNQEKIIAKLDQILSNQNKLDTIIGNQKDSGK